LLAVVLSNGDVAMSNSRGVGGAGDDVVVRSSLRCRLRTGAAAFGRPDRVIECLCLCDRSGDARVHVVVGIDVLQESLIAALAGVTPCFVVGNQFLLIGVAALGYSADGCEKNCESKKQYSAHCLGSFPYDRGDLAALYGGVRC